MSLWQLCQGCGLNDDKGRAGSTRPSAQREDHHCVLIIIFPIRTKLTWHHRISTDLRLSQVDLGRFSQSELQLHSKPFGRETRDTGSASFASSHSKSALVERGGEKELAEL